MSDLLLINLRTIGTHHCDGEVGKEAADEIERLRAELAALRAELQKVRSAAISGMDAATQHGRGLVQQAAKLRAESNPDALESERAANAILTEQLQKAEAERDALRAAIETALRRIKAGKGASVEAGLRDALGRRKYQKRAALGERMEGGQ